MTDHPGFDPYEVLGISVDADEVVIQLAYRARIRQAHPDIAGPTGLEAAKRLNLARDWLLDPDLRARLSTRSYPGPLGATRAARRRPADARPTDLAHADRYAGCPQRPGA